MASFMNHFVCKGVQNRTNGNRQTWWKTNFNMPVQDIGDGSTWLEGHGPVTYDSPATSFNLSGFVPGWEICAFYTIWHWDGPMNAGAILSSEWRKPDDSLMFQCANAFEIGLVIDSGNWYEYWFACNTGVAGWEVNESDDYRVSSISERHNYVSGNVPEISRKTTDITFSNVPNTSQLASDKPGYIWVDGNNLHYINANRWEHTMIGDSQGDVDGTPGYMWIDEDNYLHWIGENGYDYRAKRKIKEFPSTWSNGATKDSNRGTQYKGYIWVDNEYGFTHLSYIGYDGHKYVTGSGNNPYIAPY